MNEEEAIVLCDDSMMIRYYKNLTEKKGERDVAEGERGITQ